MSKSKDVIQAVDEIIAHSGHTLHLRIVSVLELEGWQVDVSPYYIDELSDKPREIDVVARKKYSYISKVDNENKTFHLLLGIDCKYVTQNVVIWSRENKLKEAALFSNFFQTKKLQNESWYRYSKFFEVGRLISEGSNAQSFQSGILQAVKASLDIFNRGKEGPTLFYPSVVYALSSDAQVFTVGKDNITRQLSGNWIYHVDYAYTTSNKAHQRQFYIDLVEEKNFIDFLHTLNDEGNRLAETLERKSLEPDPGGVFWINA